MASARSTPIAETDKAAFKPEGEVWATLKNSGDSYIYDAVKRGHTPDWQQLIPENIAIGIDTSKPSLLERRKEWNTPTPERWALPTEIWRETIERLQRCDMLLDKIKGGEITATNDFITYNLDIRSFVYDLLHSTNDHLLVKHFYKALLNVTILDPTCGSGAFLFAAMNILEPLYEVCIERMQEFNETNNLLFKEELAEIANKYRSNIQYFIFKSIILRNLYGVDIMVEATEIAKLRLFLKMVAVVEVDRHADNMGLDPLPDIDFNIRCGNTLVGYATERQLLDDLNRDTDILQMEANQVFKEQLDNELANVATTYEIFKDVQFTQETDMITFKNAKKDLIHRLNTLNELLNQRLYSATANGDYDGWLDSYQPFHWLAEFYQIMHDKGGFDVIIGNPPYVEYSKARKIYRLENFGYTTLECGNLYAIVFERCLNITHPNSFSGMIVQLPIVCSERMKNAQILLSSRNSWIYTFDDRPGKLFDNLEHIRATIFITTNNIGPIFGTKYNRWYSETRNYLFQLQTPYSAIVLDGTIPKIGGKLASSIFSKISRQKSLANYYASKSSDIIYYHNAPQYFARFSDFIPFFKNSQGETVISSHVKPIFVRESRDTRLILSVLNSSLFYWYNLLCSNCRDLTLREISNFPISIDNINDSNKEGLMRLSQNLMRDFNKNANRKTANYKATGTVVYDEYFPKLSKSIIDEIDKVLAKHYGFTEEELDFIINYDIKYRMGDELNSED